MKRGKRQIITSQPEQQMNSSMDHSQQSNNSTYFANLSSFNTTPTVITCTKPQSQQTLSVKPMQTVSQIIPSQMQQKPSEDEERRKRVELLKQKYMKKNDDSKGEGLKTTNIPTTMMGDNIVQHKVDEVKSNNLGNILPVTGDQISTNNYNVLKQEKINEKPIPTMKQSPYEMNKFKTPFPIQETNITNIQKQYPLVHEQEQTHNTQSQEIRNQNETQQETATQQKELTVKTIPHHDVPKPPAKHHFKNPPPPPLFKRPPQQQSDIEITQNQPIECKPVTIPQETPQTIPEKGSAKIIQSSPFIAKPQILSSNSSKSQKQDNISFAPPSTINSTDKFQTVQQKRLPPPPPPNRNMKDLLNKKLSSNKNVPKLPQRIQQQIPQNVEQNGFGEGNSGWGIDTPVEVNQNMNKKKTSQIDDQYNNITQSPSRLPKHPQPINYPTTLPPQPKQQVNPQKYISEWLTSPQLTLKQLHPEMKQAIEFYCLNKHLSINLSSNNPLFTPLVKQLIESFMMKNGQKYTQEQKAVAESVCMTFFYTNPAEFSDIFLIVLVKLSGQYLSKYQQALEDQFIKYLQRIVMYKNVFLPEEINLFVNFCLECNMVNEENMLLFLMLTSQSVNNQLLQFISQSDIHSLSNNLSILSYCQLNIKNKSLLPLYVKTISNLQPQWARHGMVEKVLNNLKSIDIPEHLYQYTKQLKLKLLKNYESNGPTGNQQQRFNELPNQSMNIQSQTNKDTGLFGLFSINKAIDKIKTSTEKALGTVQKQKKPQQEQKKDEIIYDPIRKRYIINGQIPEDENEPSRQQAPQQKSKIPPPPPPMGGRKPPPPIPGKKAGGRITMNRYA